MLKSIKNNWLKQRNIGKCIYFPDLNSSDSKPILTASFKALRELRDAEQNKLLKIAPTLSLRALDPFNMERQNVKRALRTFNESTVAALNSTNIQHAKGAADFIATILTGWRIMNVKTPRKDERLRDDMQCPVSSASCPPLEFLKKIPEWLDYWASFIQGASHQKRTWLSATQAMLCMKFHCTVCRSRGLNMCCWGNSRRILSKKGLESTNSRVALSIMSQFDKFTSLKAH